VAETLTPEERGREIAERYKAQREWGPHYQGGEDGTIPAGYVARGTSILRRGDGSVCLAWEKTARDRFDPFALGEQVAAGLAAGGLVPLGTVEPPSVSCDDLLSVYPLGDPHIGLYCWAAETGEAFDLNVAAQRYLAVAQCLIPRAPQGSDALLIDLGDFFHADDPQYRTSSGKNTVDMDTRYDKVIVTGIRIMCTMIDALLQWHRTVRVWCFRGNHDDRSTLTLREALRGYYTHNPRVVIDATPGKFHFLEYGTSLLGGTHSDSLKGARKRTMLEVFVTDQREAWGRTRHAKAYLGHVHHSSREGLDELGELVVETFRTIAPKDAWHAAKGYRSGRDTRLEIWHRDLGPRTIEIASIDEIKTVAEDLARAA
jgi:hypothetical protein